MLFNISKHTDLFCALASPEELPADSKSISEVLDRLQDIETYQARVKYAERNLKHLSSGSSRVVYLTPKDTVIKLAKNERGLEQNKAESRPKMKSKYLNKIISKAKNSSWIEVTKLDDLSEKEFEEMSEISFKDFGDCLEYALKNSSKKKPSCYDDIKDEDIFKEMVRLGKDFDLVAGDMSRISSWRTDGETPILADAGLTQEIFEKFYED